ncbi:MAG TPA: hypothetical protein VMV98_07425, partial [Acidobacteriaceae bacterium]|nr:hypothetical protein [Acidobacteriaceae bacterium]
PLQLFADTLQPVDFGQRGHQQHPAPATVFDRLVDGVHPDTPLRHRFELEVAGALKGNGKDAASLDDLFHSWIANSVDLDELEANSPLLQEDAAHIAAWPGLARMGLAALHYIDTGTAPPAGWQQQQESILKDANPPQELVDFVVLKPLQQLVQAASAANPH